MQIGGCLEVGDWLQKAQGNIWDADNVTVTVYNHQNSSNSHLKWVNFITYKLHLHKTLFKTLVIDCLGGESARPRSLHYAMPQPERTWGAMHGLEQESVTIRFVFRAVTHIDHYVDKGCGEKK